MREPAIPQRGCASKNATIAASAPSRNSASGLSKNTYGESVAANARLHSLAEQAQASLDADKASLERRANALNAERTTLTPAQFQAKAQALNQRGQAIQTEAAERTRQLEATRQKAFGLILQEAQPFIATAYTAHSCGLLFSREAVLGGNMANDLTPEVVVALDAGVAPVSFDLEPPAAASPQ